VKNLVKKMGAQQLGVDEINFFKDDNTVMHFVQPEGNDIN
jgi:nascent polypeptide-associated complex subunit beta